MAEMTPQDIVRTEVERTMPGTDWKVVYAQLHEMVKQPKYRIFRANNSLFVITNNGDHTADFSMCNADTLQNMPKSLAEFFKAMKVCGFTEVRFTTNRPAMFRMIERAGYKAQVFSSTGMASDDGKPVSKAKVVL